MTRIVIIGGYGAFGALVSERLAREADLDIVVAGRNDAKARAFAERLGARANARISHAVVDAATVSPDLLRAMGARIVINASGPFQTQDYTVARAAVAARCHYLDLADARGFVTGIAALDDTARDAGVLVVSGASSVPGLSSAVVRHLADQLAAVHLIDIGISPGNSFNPGEATTASVLSQVGKPFPIRLEGATRTAYGWQNLRRHAFPGLGRRWIGDVSVPDLDLFQSAYPQATTVRFGAGVEVGLFHLSLWALSRLVRAGAVSTLTPLTRPLLGAKRMLSFLGSDEGGMYVSVEGVAAAGGTRRSTWHLIARGDHGRYVPAIASVILARKLARGELARTGAMACFELFMLEDFLAETVDLDITCTTEAR